MKITLRNSIHETSVTVNIKPQDYCIFDLTNRIKLGINQIKRIKKELCPSNCRCCKPSSFKIMGSQEALIYNNKVYYISAEDQDTLFFTKCKNPIMFNWAGKITDEK
jgi:hypothetical protein